MSEPADQLDLRAEDLPRIEIDGTVDPTVDAVSAASISTRSTVSTVTSCISTISTY